MKRTIVVLGSFMLGVLSMLLVAYQASIVPTSKAQTLSDDSHGTEPVIPQQRRALESQVYSGGVYSLDGLDCRRCTFKDVIFEYAGGSYFLIDATFTGSIELRLKGAAVNTLGVIGFLESVQTQRAPMQPSKPTIMKFDLKGHTLRTDLLSPYRPPFN